MNYTFIKKSKYGNKKTNIDGVVFASQREASRYLCLKSLKTSGEIADFKVQVPYRFASGIKYILDFEVIGADGKKTHEDVKGVRTPVYKIKKKLMKHEFGIDITEV